MIVSVLSPHTGNNGNTITSIFLALGLADLKKEVFLGTNRLITDSFFTYLGVTHLADKTNASTQLIQLLSEGAVRPEDIKDYCKPVVDNLKVFTNKSIDFTAANFDLLFNSICETTNFDYYVYDLDYSSDSANADAVLKKSDVVVLNFSHNYLEFERFLRRKDKLLKVLRGKKIILVCNMYSPKVGKASDIPKKLGFKATCNVIHLNSLIRWACNTGSVEKVLWRQIKLKDPKVLELKSDIFRLASMISRARTETMKEKRGAALNGK